MAWPQQGLPRSRRIADRSLERLGASGIAIVQFRRIMVDATLRLRA